MSPQNTSAQAPPDYLAALRLERAPFLDQPDDRFFYADPMLLQRLDLLQHLTRFGDMLIGVIGPDGAGKTTLLQQFLLRGGAGWRFCRLDGARLNHANDLVGGIAECFGLPADSDAERAKATLLRHCQGLQQSGQLAVAVIDDAHRLPEAVLRALLGLGGAPGETLRAIRIVMFGNDTLEARLTDMGLHQPQQPLLHRLDIPRFDEQQSASYLMYRLAVAGHSGNCPFSLTEIRAIHKAADGRPGQLNVLAHETLMERAQRIAARKRASGAAIPRMPARGPVWLAAGLGTLALAGGAYLLLTSGPEHPPPAPTDAPPLALHLPPEHLPPIEASPEAGLDGPATETEAPPPSLPSSPAAEPAESSDAGTATPPPAAPELPAEAESRAEAESAPGPETGSPLRLEPPVPAAEPAASPPSDETAANGAPPPAASEAPADQPAAAVAAPSAAPPDASTATDAGPPAAAPAPAPAPDGLLREDWIAERPGTHFTLQLLGVRTESALRRYFARQALPSPVAYFRTKYKGGDWYVLVQGEYASIEAARAAVDSLPAAVRKASPWPRSFASVQADLKKGQ